MIEQPGLPTIVVDAVGVTRGEETARVRYEVRFIQLFAALVVYRGKAPDDESARQREREVWAHRQQNGLRGSWGRIDLDGDRSFYRRADYWKLWIDGTGYSGRPGKWKVNVTDRALNEDEPQWLLALLEGCVAARRVAVGVVRGERLECFATVCDFRSAAESQTRKMVPTVSSGLAATGRADVDVWLDSRRRIRRAGCYDGHHRTVIELKDFGFHEPITPPARSEIWTEPT